MRPLDPPFPPLQSSPQPERPLAQGWPAAPGSPIAPQPSTEGIQYTERVPAPPVARPLLSRPQLQAPESAMAAPSSPVLPNGDGWGETYLPAGGDDPDWKPSAWPAAPQAPQSYEDDFARAGGDRSSRQFGRDDDWRPARNPSSHGSQSRYSQNDFPSEYTDQRIALRESSQSVSRDDWAGLSQSGPHSEALRYRGGFSATELGLPRLTNPALQGELPPEWEDLLADEILPRREDVGPGVSRRQAPSRRNPPDSYAYSSAGHPYEANRPPAKPSSRRMQADIDGNGFGESVAAKSGRQRPQPMPTLASAHVAAFTANRAPASSAAEQKAKREQRGMPGRRRWSVIVLLGVVVLMLVGSTGVVLAKPSICPGSVCTQANSFLHRHLSFLGPAPNANVLQATPGNLTVQAVAGSSTNLNVQVSNSGTDSAVWHASASVGWLTVSPPSGTLPAGGTMTLSVAAAPANVPPGNYSAQLLVETPSTSIKIPVTAAIAMGPKIGLSTTSLNVTQCGVAQTFKVNNTGDKPLSYTASSPKATAVTLTNASGTVESGASATVSFTMNCSAFWGDYTVNVASNGGNGTVTIHYT